MPDFAANSLHYFFVTNLLFLCQGVYARHLLGNASAPNAAQFGQCVEPLAKIALQVAQRLLAFSFKYVVIDEIIFQKVLDVENNGGLLCYHN